MTNLKVTSATLVKQITGDRKKATSRINSTHPNTLDWELNLTDDGLLCRSKHGRLLLIPLTNIIEMEVEYVEGAASKVPKAKVKKAAKTVK